VGDRGPLRSTLEPAPYEPEALAAHRPDEVDCPVATWGLEAGGLEVQTGACTYLALGQPVRLSGGDLLDVVLWHDALDAAEPGEGHAALWLDDQILWEVTVPIPSPAGFHDAAVAVPHGGGMLGWHLHNHGYNSWTLAELTIR